MHFLNKVDLSHECIANKHEVIESTAKARAQKASPIDCEALQLMVAWLPVDIIKATIDNTTQFYHTPSSVHLKK